MTPFATIESACELVTDGTHYTPKDVGVGIPFLTVKDVSGEGLDFENCSFISESDFILAKAGNSAPRRGDVLFSKDGTVGKVHVVSTDRPFAVLSSLAILRPNPTKANADYLGHVLRFPAVLDDALKKKTGSAIRRIVLGDLKRVRFPLPKLEEQRRIAAILDQAETLRTQRRTALVLLDSLTQSIFLDMFGDPVANPKGWQREKLGNLTSKMGSGSTPSGGDAAYKAEGISLIRSLNVHDGEFKYKNLAYIDETQAAKLSNVQVAEGDVLLNITGASVARVCRAPSDVLPARVNQHVMIVRPKSTLNGLFLERMLLSETMKRALLQIGGAGATREAITKAQAEELLVPLPPLPLQQTFATRIASIEALKATHRRALAALDALFASLQQRAFAGML